MTDQLFIIVSGMPASGKTSLATSLAAEMGLPLFDKDVILESLFEEFGAIDMSTRGRLSRESDRILSRTAMASHGAVIVSFWQHPKAVDQAGTPVDWLTTLPGRVIEVHCVCPPALAEQRFRSRQRHAGHNDALRSAGLAEQMLSLANLGPLGLWDTVRVPTDRPYDVRGVHQAIQFRVD